MQGKLSISTEPDESYVQFVQAIVIIIMNNDYPDKFLRKSNELQDMSQTKIRSHKSQVMWALLWIRWSDKYVF